MANSFSDFPKKGPPRKNLPVWVTVSVISDAPPPLPESVRTDARSYADVITKLSRLDGLPIFLIHGASLARFARGSSANIPVDDEDTMTLSISFCAVQIVLLYISGPCLSVLALGIEKQDHIFIQLDQPIILVKRR